MIDVAVYKRSVCLGAYDESINEEVAVDLFVLTWIFSKNAQEISGSEYEIETDLKNTTSISSSWVYLDTLKK